MNNPESEKQFDSTQDFDEYFSLIWEQESVFTEMLVNFLKKAALIDHPHFNSPWLYETYPMVESIVFNPKMNRAVMKFGFGNIGGEALLKKRSGKWFIVAAQPTWIS